MIILYLFVPRVCLVKLIAKRGEQKGRKDKFAMKMKYLLVMEPPPINWPVVNLVLFHKSVVG
eukprot:15341385-Ditylum_brightwellii.AAC.1